MSSRVKWILGTLVLAAVTHIAFVAGLPYMIMFVVKIVGKVEPNKIFHAPPITDKSRQVVRPSPDLLYSACPFDISEKPLRISAPVPDTYFSISGYASNTDNFFAINDRQAKSGRIEIILVKKGKSYVVKSGAKIIESPSNQGAILYRTLIKDESKLGELIKFQKQATCESVE